MLAEDFGSDSEPSEFDFGGIFIFEKEDRWAYRTNEFYNGRYESAFEKMMEQKASLFHMFNLIFSMLPNIRNIEGPVPLKSSIEIVHRIWRFE